MQIQYFDRIVYDYSSGTHLLGLVLESGYPVEIPVLLGRKLDLSMGEGKRCMVPVEDGRRCLEPVKATERLCRACKGAEDTCVYGASKLQWDECPENRAHDCCDRSGYVNYLASYGLFDSDSHIDLKSGISINPRKRTHNKGYSFVAVLASQHNTLQALRGSLLQLAVLHEVMIPAIAATYRLSVPKVSEAFSWSSVIPRLTNNLAQEDGVSFLTFKAQVQHLMDAVQSHCNKVLQRGQSEQWADFRSLLENKQALWTMDGGLLYDRVRNSQLFSTSDGPLRISIAEVYSTLKLKRPKYLLFDYPVNSPSLKDEITRLTKEASPQECVIRIRHKPKFTHLEGNVELVRGQSVVMRPPDPESTLGIFIFERLSRGRPVVAWSEVAGLSKTESGATVVQRTLDSLGGD